MRTPTVSVVVPTHNRCDLVGGALESILGQTFGDLELLVVDDASNDATPGVLANYAAHDSRIRLFRNDEPLGCNDSRNRALDEARGTYIAFLDDDDRAAPERLERTVGGFTEVPQAAIVTTAFQMVDIRGEPHAWSRPETAFASPITTGDEAFEKFYCDWLWMPTCTVAVRADVLADMRYPSIRRRDGDSIFHMALTASGASILTLPDLLSFICRDDRYQYMTADTAAALADRRRSLEYVRSRLSAAHMTKHDHLHARAWSNHLVREAEYYGGVRGLALAARALAAQPSNRNARSFLAAAAKRPVDTLSGRSLD